MRVAACAALLVGIVLTLAGCGDDAVTPTVSGLPSPAETDSANPPQVPGDIAYAVLFDVSVADVEAFWAREFPAVFDSEFEPVSAVVEYRPSDPENVPTCHGAPAPPNNAFYCDDGDYIGVDVENFFPDIYESLGDVAAATIVAHEYGHAIQHRVDVLNNPTFLVEQQADCLAGAWVASAGSMDGAGSFVVTDDDLNQTLAAILQIADPIGMVLMAPGAHGTGFDRLRAFSDGYEGGVAPCSAYVVRPPQREELPYRLTLTGPVTEPLDELLPTVTDSLETFWGFVFPDLSIPTLVNVEEVQTVRSECEAAASSMESGAAVWCRETNSVVFSWSGQQDLWNRAGDVAAVYPIVHAWTQAVVSHISGAAGAEARLITAADCLAGVWHGRLAAEYERLQSEPGSPRYSFFLSAGDLDEILTGMLLAPVAGPDGVHVDDVTPFNRADAFGDGFIEGETSCVLP